MIKYGREPFLECSTKGDKRFSAFCAKIKGRDNKSIESIYQAAKIFDNGTTNLSWKEAKGKIPINAQETSELYSRLWDEYISENPHLIDVLLSFNGISDIFGQNNHCCQATELWRIRNNNLNKQTKIVNIQKDKYDVYIGRNGHGQDGYFGNPYRIGWDGNREEIIELYKQYFYDRIENDIKFKEKIHSLKGKTLGCFCKPKKCHGDIIAEYLNNLEQQNMIKFSNCDCEIETGKFDINNIPLTCEATWDLISSGKTVGIFQLETQLGQQWAEKAQPKNIKELSDLIALLRPGPMESLMSELYVDRKSGKKPIEYLHPSLKRILKDSYGCLIYQEEAMKIAVELAGFSPEQSDNLRKAAGKKLPALMTKLKNQFIEGSEKLGKITKEQAEEIFSWIEKSQRYSFNKCVSGDTIIKRFGNNQYNRKFTIEQMFTIMHYNTINGEKIKTSVRNNWIKQGNYGYGLSLCSDGIIRKNIIEDIQPAGTQQLYKIILENGASIRATQNHKFPTQFGDKKLKDLQENDKLYCLERIKYKKYRSTIENRDRTKIYQPINDKKYKPGDKGYRVQLIKIKKILKDKIENVWDVTMRDPYHNFVNDDNIVTCNSHSISYAMLTFQSAYMKAHFPKEFFVSYLSHSKYKGDPKEEIHKLVQDAKLFDINILPPDITKGNIDFETTENPEGISFGLSHIKGVGATAIEKIKSNKYDLSTWNKFLCSIPRLHRDVGISLVKSGACDIYQKSRASMVKELELILGYSIRDEDGNKKNISGLTRKEMDFFCKLLNEGYNTKEALYYMASLEKINLNTMKKDSLIKIIEESGLLDINKKYKKSDLIKIIIDNQLINTEKSPCTTQKRRTIVFDKAKELENKLEDSYTSIAESEKHFLGIALSCSPVDDIKEKDASHTCLDIAQLNTGENMSVCAIIDNVKHTKTKKGKNPGSPMCFLTISDSTYSIDHAVVFPDVYLNLKNICQENIICRVDGYKKNGSFIVTDMEKLL